jgi:ribonuclease BN (tRNA processing enzyme)
VPDDHLRLTIVGSAPAWSLRPGQPSSCYLVELGGDALVLDLGQGSLGSLAAIRAPESMTAIVVSHLHPDHHVDLVALRHYLKYGLEPSGSVRLHAPGELRARYDSFLGEPDFLAELPGADLAPGTFTVGPFSVEARPVTHALNSFGFRVTVGGHEDGPGLVYSGDCGRWQDLLPLTHAGDTLLSEAFWGASAATEGAGHMTALEAASAAHEAGAARLVLTHIPEAHDPLAAQELARSTFDGPVLLATPGARFNIGAAHES